MKKDYTAPVVMVAIVCLTIIELFALLQGINGTLMLAMGATIAGLAGWQAPQLKVDNLKKVIKNGSKGRN